MKKGWFVPYSVMTGADNMAVDEKLLDYAIEQQLDFPIFRLYGWNPACVSLGRHQKESCVNKSFCETENIHIVKRLTGGRALFHCNELTYSFVCPASFLEHGETIISSYREISGALALGFQKAGINLSFPDDDNKKRKSDEKAIRPEYCMSATSVADLSIDGKKIIGSAQFRKKGYILQHGSVMYDYDVEKIEKIFGELPLENKITTLRDILPFQSQEEVFSKLKRTLPSGVEEFFSIKLETVDIKDFL